VQLKISDGEMLGQSWEGGGGELDQPSRLSVN